jgi:hypothetical protein
MIRHRKSRHHRSKQRREDEKSGTNSPIRVVKPDEEAVKQWVFEAGALLEPGQFDPVKAGRLKTEMDVMMLAVQRPEADQRAASEKEYFDWLAANIPRNVQYTRPTTLGRDCGGYTQGQSIAR